MIIFNKSKATVTSVLLRKLILGVRTKVWYMPEEHLPKLDKKDCVIAEAIIGEGHKVHIIFDMESYNAFIQGEEFKIPGINKI